MKFPTNPLPGMNPWLEAYWGDVHTRLTTYSCDAIQKQLPVELQARVEEYLSVLEPEDRSSTARRISPDVHVVEQPGVSPALVPEMSKAASILTEDEPVRIRRRSLPQTLHTIQIVDRKAGRRVVTAIEFISRANKSTTAGRDQYIGKQEQLIEAGVNLVEIDLIRGGSWVLAADSQNYPERCLGPYRVCVVRSENTAVAEVYRATFRARLPTIRIPLRAGDDDVMLPLQSILNMAYENGRYGNDLDYSQAPDPPLHELDQKWIDDYLLKNQ